MPRDYIRIYCGRIGRLTCWACFGSWETVLLHILKGNKPLFFVYATVFFCLFISLFCCVLRWLWLWFVWCCVLLLLFVVFCVLCCDVLKIISDCWEKTIINCCKTMWNVYLTIPFTLLSFFFWWPQITPYVTEIPLPAYTQPEVFNDLSLHYFKQAVLDSIINTDETFWTNSPEPSQDDPEIIHTELIKWANLKR